MICIAIIKNIACFQENEEWIRTENAPVTAYDEKEAKERTSWC